MQREKEREATATHDKQKKVNLFQEKPTQIQFESSQASVSHLKCIPSGHERIDRAINVIKSGGEYACDMTTDTKSIMCLLPYIR